MKDSEFIRGEKIPMTKSEVRSVVLDRLELHAATRLLDVGAGTGSIGIEAAIKYPNLRVVAIEQKEEAAQLIKSNGVKFGCSEQIKIIQSTAPCEITGKMDAIFIGGGGEQIEAIIDWSMSHLIPNGRLVLTFILQENLHTALTHLKTHGITDLECTQMLVSQMTKLGTGMFFKPNNPTFIMSCKKDPNHGK